MLGERALDGRVEVEPGELADDRPPQYDFLCGLILKDLFDDDIDELVDSAELVVHDLGEPIERATIKGQYISA